MKFRNVGCLFRCFRIKLLLQVKPDRWVSKEQNGGVEPKLWSGGMIPFQNGNKQ